MRIGIHIGAGADPMTGVTQDEGSGVYVPATADEWNTTLAAAGILSGGPSALWLMQEASGNFADSIASYDLTAALFLYQNDVIGWSRKGASLADGQAAQAFRLSGVGDIGAVSGLLLAYISIDDTPGGTRDVIGLGSSTTFRGAQVTTTPVYRAQPNDGSATQNGAANPGTTVHPVIIHVDRTAGTWRVITDQEIVTPSPYTAPPVAGDGIFIGSALVTAAPLTVLYAAAFRSTAAELTDAQIRALLTALGWTVAW